MYADKPQYRQYERMLVDLHALIAAGEECSSRANLLREQMEIPEAYLTESEILRLNALSGDLSMTHDREIPDTDVVARVPAAELSPRLVRAYQSANWEELLSLLRADVSAFLKSDQIAYMRSRAYDALGETAPAVAFIDEAARRNPLNANYPSLAMEYLLKEGRNDEAYARAKAHLAVAATPSRVVVMAGGVLSRLAQQDHPPADLPQVARGALDRIDHAVSQETSAAVRSAGRVSVALLAVFTNENVKAATALQAALDEPDDLAHVHARGMLARELEFVRAGKTTTPEARALSRDLSLTFAPSLSLQAA